MTNAQSENLQFFAAITILFLIIVSAYGCYGCIKQGEEESKRRDVQVFDSFIGVRDLEAIRVFGSDPIDLSREDYFITFNLYELQTHEITLATATYHVFNYYRSVTFEVKGHYIQGWRAK
jgi:hypothetical protein